MKIVSVETIPVYVPYRPEVGTVVTSGMTATGAGHLVVQVHTDEGLTGLGEGVPRPSVYGETLASIVAAIDTLLVPPIVGLDPLNVEQVWARWSRVVGNISAKSAIDMALHDLIGQQLGVPLYKLLGGWANGRISVSMPISMANEADMIRQAEKAVKEGFHAIKAKVGMDVRIDVRNIAAIRRAIGDDVMLYADANQGYAPSDALRAIRQFEKFGIALIEEPIAASDVAGRARLARAIDTPILLDESINLLSDVLREIQIGTAGALNVRSPRTGFTLTRRVVGLAEAANVPCLVGSHRELGIGTVASAHIAAAYRCMSYPAELGVYVHLEDGLLAEPLRIEGGYLYLPDKPGLGIALDPKKVARYRV